MALLEISDSTKKDSGIVMILLSPIGAALATAQWGGRFVSSLGQAGLLCTGIAATIQMLFGLYVYLRLDAGTEGIVTNEEIRTRLSIILGNVLTGGTVYAIGALAVKAGLISSALTLPAVASLVIIPAVIESCVCPYLLEAAGFVAEKLGLLKVVY